MPQDPAPANPGRDDPRAGAQPGPDSWEPVVTCPDPMSAEEWQARADRDAEDDFDPDRFQDEDEFWGPGEDLTVADLAALAAEADRMEAERALDAAFLAAPATAELAGRMLADEACKRGPRGPGLPGSAERVPGVSSSPAVGFGAGGCLDTMAGSAELLGFIERSVDSGRLGQASQDELVGLVCAADRAEATACALKHAVVAELIRQRPAPGARAQEPSGTPEAYLDSAADEVKWALAETRSAADGMLSLAWDLEVKLPGTGALFRDGLLRHSKVEIIADNTAVLDPDEARAAERMVLAAAREMSPAQLRRAIQLAVATVAPSKAKDRREHGAKKARVERWSEDSGNAGLAIREAAPVLVLAADQRIAWWEIGRAHV